MWDQIALALVGPSWCTSISEPWIHPSNGHRDEAGYTNNIHISSLYAVRSTLPSSQSFDPLILHTMLLRTTICFLHATVVFAATSSYKLELMWDIGAPDGHEREMVFINGDYPGPILEAQQGDWVEVEVYNKLPFNTSIHFHGTHYASLTTEHIAES